MESANRLPVLVVSLTVILHALRWTLDVPVGWTGIAFSLLVSAWMGYRVAEPVWRSRDVAWWKRCFVSSIVAVLAVGVAWDISGHPLFGEDVVLLHWTIYAVWAAATISLVRKKLKE